MGHSAAPAVSLSFAQTQPHVAGINELGAAVSLRIARHQRSDLLGGPVAAQGLQELRCLPVVLLLLLGILRSVGRHGRQVQWVRVFTLQHTRLRLTQLRLLREAQVRFQAVEKAAQIGHGSWNVERMSLAMGSLVKD